MFDSARISAEPDARHDAARGRALFAAATAGMVEIAHDGRILMANGAFCRMIGYAPAELCGMAAGEVFFPEDRDRVLAEFGEVAAGRATAYEADRRYRRKDGSALPARVSVVAQAGVGPPPRASAVVIDLTDRAHLEEQLRHAGKLAAVGLRASGIAHDFNNLLAVIGGCAETVLDGLPAADPAGDLLREMTAACRRAAGLTEQLLAFTRKAARDRQVFALSGVVARAVRLLRGLVGPGVALVTDLGDDPGAVAADAAQLEQVILNLAVNAKDAMPVGGTLAVETHAVRVRAADRAAYPDLAAGDYAQLTVADTGAGMTDAVRARAFEPFFTTKDIGKGTGLGLALVREAVERCGGWAGVFSEPGVGTAFEILLPVVDSGAAAGPAPRGVGTVLLVEADGAARKLARLALTWHGYDVLEAGGAAEALRLADDHTGPLELLVAAVALPDGGGRAVADAVRARHPGIKVLYLTEAADDAAVVPGGTAAPAAAIRKPFTPVSLARRVRAVLDGTG